MSVEDRVLVDGGASAGGMPGRKRCKYEAPRIELVLFGGEAFLGAAFDSGEQLRLFEDGYDVYE